jgi:opacity protein-like surface antigen
MIVCTGSSNPPGGVYMTKKLLLVLAIVMIVTTGAFAQLTFGITGNQYAFEDEAGNLPSLSSVWDDFKEGRGTYWGFFGEIILGKLGLGLAFNYQNVPEFGYDFDGDGTVQSDELYPEMWSYDANVYLSYHILGGRSFLDPFLQAGLGKNAYDFKNKDDKTIYNSLGPDDPLFASPYWDFGAGLGINLGGLGIFIKGAYIVPMEGVLTGTSWPDEFDGSTFEYDIMPWYLNGDFKYTFGAKLIL